MTDRRPQGYEFQLDPQRVRRSFDAAAETYDAAAVLQQRIRGELLSRLDLVRLDPAVILDLGAGTGAGSLELKRRYRKARIVALDPAEGMLRVASRRRTLFRRFDRVCGNGAALPFKEGSVDLVFSNLAVHWCNEPDRVFAECRRVLRPGGLLTFTTFGPDTLVELRRAWAAGDGHTHVNRFIDMHDLGDALVRSGLAEPVMDVERYTLTYGDVRHLANDLRAMGATNCNAGRSHALTGKQTLARVIASYEANRTGGRLPATFEVVYGQAWSAVGPMRQRSTGEVTVPISALRRRGLDN